MNLTNKLTLILCFNKISSSVHFYMKYNDSYTKLIDLSKVLKFIDLINNLTMFFSIKKKKNLPILSR